MNRALGSDDVADVFARAAAEIPFTRSDRHTLEQRLPAVSAVIYSIFFEGPR